jgi:hypothetical protein
MQDKHDQSTCRVWENILNVAVCYFIVSDYRLGEFILREVFYQSLDGHI